MPRYNFPITLSGEGDNPDEAWEHAIEQFVVDPGTTPDEIQVEPEEDGDDGCPKDDPGCLGRDEDRHDACELPEAPRQPIRCPFCKTASPRALDTEHWTSQPQMMRAVKEGYEKGGKYEWKGRTFLSLTEYQCVDGCGRSFLA